jgi:hypothetical protein
MQQRGQSRVLSLGGQLFVTVVSGCVVRRED